MSDSGSDDDTPVVEAGGTLRRYDSHFHKKHCVLEVRDASFTVGTPKGPKRILSNINFVAESGSSYALMGPSGAGKTTLLELLTLGLKGGKAVGSVTLNNQKLTFETFRRQAVYVEQYDTHWAFLTCKETMQYAARLYIPGDRFEQEERVSHVMTKLGLNECANTYAGNQFFKGMSGGQKKRLTLGMALLKAPVLLVLDEPTSGLDATSTDSVMKALKDMCKECNLIAIATIHQPSTEVFMGFSEVMFMANGRTAYCGKTSEVGAYCESIGKRPPPHTNPADWFIDLINSEFAGRDAVDEIVHAWGNKHQTSQRRELSKLPPGVRPRTRHQLWTIFSRQFLLSLRDPTLYLGRMGAFLIANVFFAFVFWKTRPLEQRYVEPKFYLVGWFVGVPTLLSVVVVFATNEEFHLVRKEIKNGMLKTGGYLLCTTFLTVPYMIILSFFALYVPAVIADWDVRPSAILEPILTFALTLWSFEAMGQFIGVTFKNAMVGMLAMMGLWFCTFLFMGSFLQEEFIIWPFRILVRSFPLYWTMRALSYQVFFDTEWHGAVDTELSPTGFYCPDIPIPKQYLCWGRTGKQVLTRLSHIYSDATPHDERFDCILAICCIGAFFKLCNILVVVLSSRQVSEIHDECSDSESSDGSPQRRYQK
jgi:ABC-type multidrug transport system ATPase subunit